MGKGKKVGGSSKEVPIKAVPMAVPNYAMSCFILPKTFHMELNSILANFWSGDSNLRRKVHWKSRKHLSTPKTAGGGGWF